MSKVLVTGATGFTGGHLAVALLRRGDEVRVLVRPGSQVSALRQLNVEIVTGDIVNADDVRRAVDGIQQIYHMAALYRSSKHSDDVFRQVNVDGTNNILQAAQRAGVRRVVHCSTIGVHGDVQDVPANETSDFRPSDIYQQTKLEGERLAQQAFANGLSGVVVRPAGIYGPGDMRFLKLFTMIKRGRFRMFGSGETFCHLVYIDDLVDGIIRCGQHPAAVGETYILAGDRYVTLNELAALVADATHVSLRGRRWPFWLLLATSVACEQLCRRLHVEPPLHRRRAEFFVKNRAFSIEKAKSEIGFAPRIDLAEGLRKTTAWYEGKGLL